MIHALGILLTLIASLGFLVLWEGAANLIAYLRARLRGRASPHARDEERDALDNETRRQWDDDEDLFI